MERREDEFGDMSWQRTGSRKIVRDEINESGNLLTTYTIDPSQHSYIRSEQFLFRDTKRIYTEIKLPWISVADSSFIVEEKDGGQSRRVVLEKHGDQQSLRTEVVQTHPQLIILRSTYSEEGNLGHVAAIFLSKETKYNKVFLLFADNKTKLSLEMKNGNEYVQDYNNSTNILVDTESARIQLKMDDKVLEVECGLEKSKSIFEIQKKIDFQSLCDKIQSNESDTWKDTVSHVIAKVSSESF